MIKNVLFDLDGTLTDSREGIINGFIYALNSLGIKEEDRKSIEKYIGPPLDESFRNGYGLDEEQVKNAVNKYREYYSAEGLYLNKIYQGMKELIIDLYNNDKKVILATAKPLEFSRRILEQNDILQYFNFLSAYMIDGTRTTKQEIIKYALDNIENLNLDESILFGGRHYDIECAKVNNLKTIGVTYGFGSEEELKDAGATYIAHDMKELHDILFEF